jgi:hypothetical protein
LTAAFKVLKPRTSAAPRIEMSSIVSDRLSPDHITAAEVIPPAATIGTTNDRDRGVCALLFFENGLPNLAAKWSDRIFGKFDQMLL